MKRKTRTLINRKEIIITYRPGAQAPKRGSLPGMTSSAGFFQPMDGQEQFEREYEMAKVHSQVQLRFDLFVPVLSEGPQTG